MSSFSSSSLLPPVVLQHCTNVPLLYELLKGEEERSRVWLRNEMNQIPDPLIDSLFHGLIMSSSSSAVPQSRLTVSELCQQLDGEKVEVRMVLRGEMDRVVNTLFERLTNKLMANTDLNRYQLEDGGGDGARLTNLVGQFESPNTQMHYSASLFCQPSTSTFVLDSHQQHSNGDELELNTVEMIEIKEEVEDGEETRLIDIEALTEDSQGAGGESRFVETNQQMDCVKQGIKEEFEDYEEEIEIKQEDEEDGETHNNEVEIKQEIKEEEDGHDDDCDGCDQCLVKREMTSDDDDHSMQLDDSDQVAQSTQVVQSSDAQANIDQVINRENAVAGEDEQDLGGDDDEMLNTANATNDGSVVVSNEPFTSARRQSSRTTSKQATGSTPQNVTKRKQSQPNCTVKRSRKTVEDDGGEDRDEEDIDNEDREEAKVKVLYFNCTESKCSTRLDSLDDLHDHLRTVHRLLPLQCFAANCNLRFNDRKQIRDHIKLHHSQITQFLCPVCPKEYDSQQKAYKHWHRYHLKGQFQCNFVFDCAEVTDTRNKMRIHQQTKHHSKQLHCTHVGCTASFAFKHKLKRHESSHLNTQPFHCDWPQCNIRTNQRSNLVRHIRVQHFGLPRSMKEQMAKNIVDVRDPNEYVRVVLQEDE